MGYGAKQEHKAIVKCELAKVRIAVSSPLELYLKQAWMMELTGSFYLN